VPAWEKEGEEQIHTSPEMPGRKMGGASRSTHRETDAIGRKKSPQQQKEFAAATAEVTGESKSTINRQLAIADALGAPR